MHGHHDMPFVPLMLMLIEATPCLVSHFRNVALSIVVFSYLPCRLRQCMPGASSASRRERPYQAIIDTAIILARDGFRPQA
jgi:hypothetical protein